MNAQMFSEHGPWFISVEHKRKRIIDRLCNELNATGDFKAKVDRDEDNSRLVDHDNTIHWKLEWSFR